MKRLMFLIFAVGFAEPVYAQCSTKPTAEEIVICEQQKAGGAAGLKDPANILTFLKATASSLTAAGIPGGPFGILVKDGGHNCNGYSCDIICSGNGPAQKQWDVLGDAGGASTPRFDGPLSPITVRPCEIVTAPTPTPAPVPQPPTVDLGPILARLDALEKENAALKAEDVKLRAEIAAIPAPLTCATLPEYRGRNWLGTIVSRAVCK